MLKTCNKLFTMFEPWPKKFLTLMTQYIYCKEIILNLEKKGNIEEFN